MIKEIKDIKQVLGDGKVEFHSDVEKVDKELLVGRVIIIKEIRLFQDWDSEFGTSDFALALIENEKGGEATTLFGGKVVLKQLRLLASRRGSLPVKARVSRVLGRNQREYIILDSTEPSEEK